MNWTCEFCQRPATLTSASFKDVTSRIDIDKELYHDGKYRAYSIHTVVCPNMACQQLSLSVDLDTWEYIDNPIRDYWGTKDTLGSWQLLPDSSAKPQPNYIPKQIVDDYTEACRIKRLSPKASATLARRCLQGMIRDFWDIDVPSKKLYDEITQLEDKVSASEWEAIDALRSVGNIGAHMKQDVSIIVEVEPEEAELLIEFIEGLFKDWYVARHDREVRNKRLKEMATSKGEKPRDSKSKAEEKSDE